MILPVKRGIKPTLGRKYDARCVVKRQSCDLKNFFSEKDVLICEFVACRKRHATVSVPRFSKAIFSGNMKNIKQKPKNDDQTGFDYEALKLLIESLAEVVNKQRIDLLQQGKEILEMLQGLIESVDIIAREIQRQAERKES
jgi:hypothetical protein